MKRKKARVLVLCDSEKRELAYIRKLQSHKMQILRTAFTALNCIAQIFILAHIFGVVS